MTAAGTPVARTAPATYGQQGQWYEQMAAPPTRRHLFNLCQSWKLTKPADPSRVRAVLAELVRRHEGLRTTLVRNAAGELVQRVHEAGPLDIPTATVTDPDAPVLRHPLVAKVSQEPFDLGRELPVRFGLLDDTGGLVRLVLCVVNHSASDAFAHALLRNEFHQLLGTSPRLWTRQDESRAQPCDIAASEHSPLGRRRHERTLAHLRGKLREVPVSSGSAQGGEGITGKKPRTIVRLDLYSTALRTASRWVRGAERVSLGALVLAPFSSLLAAYTGEEALPFKVMVTNRFEQGTGASMACMCQPGLTVLRGSPGETVTEAAQRCQHALLTAYHHGKYDIAAVERLFTEAAAERGPVRLERLFDCLDKVPGDLRETAPGAAELTPLVSEVTCSEPFQAHGTEMTLRVRGRAADVWITLLTDTDVLPATAARQILRGVESAAVSSCLGPPPAVADLAAGFGLTPAAR